MKIFSWVRKSFDALVHSLSQLKGQYVAMEQALVSISKELKVEPLNASVHIQTLPKAQDMADLKTRVDCLLKENNKLKNQIMAKEV